MSATVISGIKSHDEELAYEVSELVRLLNAALLRAQEIGLLTDVSVHEMDGTLAKPGSFVGVRVLRPVVQT